MVIFKSRIPNLRHELVNCDTIDNDPHVNDMRTMCAWGVNLGVDFNGRYGVVTNTAKYSQYYRPQEQPGGRPLVIIRQYIGSAPEKGTKIKDARIYVYYDENSKSRGLNYYFRISTYTRDRSKS